jgi:hypothetical protein
MRSLAVGFSIVAIAVFAASADAQKIKLGCNVITPTDPFQECNSDNFTPRTATGAINKKKIKTGRPAHFGLSNITGRNGSTGRPAGSTAGNLGNAAGGALSGVSGTLGGLLR